MKYSDSKEKSAEYLRLVLPLLTQHPAAMHPVSYAVWYEYVSGCNGSLKMALDDHLRHKTAIDEEHINALYQKYIADMNEELALRVSNDFHQAMANISQSAEHVGHQAGEFGDALGKFIDSPVKDDKEQLAGILSLTQGMQQTISTLNERLVESQREVEELRQEVIKAREDALVDGLTGLANRRAFALEIEKCLANRQHDEQGPCLLVADIDHFKLVNDNWGHLFGDKVLRAVSRMLQDNVKGQDTVARYGGEEFIIILPDTSINGAQRLAEVIRSKVERCRIMRADDHEAVAYITISLGAASHLKNESVDSFIARADEALYESKNNGRNRVTIARS